MTTCQLLDPPPPVCGCLDGLSLANAIRAAIKAVGSQPPKVVEYLAAHGRVTQISYVYDVIRRDAPPPRRQVPEAALHAAGVLIAGKDLSR
jgi:hypothetical protein